MNTDTGNSASFTALAFDRVAVGGGHYPISSYAANGLAYITFAGAPSAGKSYVYDQPNSGSTYYFSLTTKLIAPTESLRIYLTAFQSNSDFSATLGSGGSYTANDVALPTNLGTAPAYGILTLDITGNIGDMLTFTDTGVATTSNNGNIGIQAADVVVPEPATLGLLAAGGLGLLLLKRRKMA